MIQEANIGIGIAGREGLQAARAADYSIGKFRFLKRLLLIHGRYSYIRTAFISQYCFYKSLFICFIQIMYCFLTGFSGTSYFNTFALTAYNIIFTSIAPVLYILDKDVPEYKIWNNPSLYIETQRGANLNIKTIILWSLRAFLQALIVFLTTIFAYYGTGTADYNSVSMVTYTAVIFVNSLTVATESNSMTWVNHLGIWGSIVAYFVLMTIINSFPASTMYYVMFHLFGKPTFWFTALIATVVAMIPVYIVKLLSKSSPSSGNDPSIRLDHFSAEVGKNDTAPLLSNEL